jgi:hypothetical protein
MDRPRPRRPEQSPANEPPSGITLLDPSGLDLNTTNEDVLHLCVLHQTMVHNSAWTRTQAFSRLISRTAMFGWAKLLGCRWESAETLAGLYRKQKIRIRR